MSTVNDLWNARKAAVHELRAFEARNPDQSKVSAADHAIESRMNDEVTRLSNLMDRAMADEQRSAALGASVDRFDARNGAAASHEQRDAAADAFLRTAKVGDSAHFTLPLETRAAIMKSNTGASATPTVTFDQIIADKVFKSSELLNAVTTLNTTSGEDIVVPTTLARPVAAIVAEGGTIAKSDGTLQTVTLKAWKYALISQASSELVADSSVNAAAYVGNIAGEAIALGLESDLLVGNGTTAPQGMNAAGTTGATLAVAGTMATDSLLDLLYSMSAPYRRGASFVMSDAAVVAARKLKGSDGQYIWQPALSAGAPDTLFGVPVIVSAYVPAFAATAARKLVTLVNKDSVVLRIAGGLEVLRSDEYAYDTDLVSWRFKFRADSRIVDAKGVRNLVNP